MVCVSCWAPYGHEGGALGEPSAFQVFPAQGHVLIGLANIDPDAMENTIYYIVRRLPLGAKTGIADESAL